MVVTIIHGVGDQQIETVVSLPAVPQAGDQVYLPNYKSGEVRQVEYILTDDNGFILSPPVVKVRLR